MSRRRNPLEKARLTGAVAKNPQRYRARSEPPSDGDVGAPPDHLPASAKKQWRQFADELPWLRRSDRALLASASLLRARLHDHTEPLPAAFMREMRATLSALGATPVDRQRIGWTSLADDDDPLAAFETDRRQ